MAFELEYLREFNFWSVLLRLSLALVFGGIIGMERGRQGRAAGMRTHILVCLGAALTALIGHYAITTGLDTDPMRIGAQVISGIGFLGVGTILLKGRFQITGLTTAAGLWCAAAIGLALGIGFYEGALIAFVFVLISVTVLHNVEYRVFIRSTRFGIYVEIRSGDDITRALEFLKSTFTVTDLQVTAPRSGISGNVGIEANVHTKSGSDITPESARRVIEREEFVVFALESI